MKKYLILIFVVVLFASCKSQTNKHTHTHNGSSDSHTHLQNDYFGSYNIKDTTYGTITNVTIENGVRKMVTNALPNHETGEFPRKGNPNTVSAQSRSYTFPVNPKYTGKAKWIRETGVALNGVKFEPGTAEVVKCDTGENYRVEALQDVIDLGLDFNHAHVQPTGAYHYHGSPTSVIDKFDTGADLVHVGFAHDGFPMYYSKTGKYKSSFRLLKGNREGEDCVYENPHNKIDISIGGHHDGTYGSDFEYVDGLGDLDECNGITINDKYIYLVTDEFPYISRCVMGEVSEEKNRRGNRQGGGKPKPGVKEIFNKMDANKDGKLSNNEVKGPLKNDFSEIDTNKDGFLSKKELENAPRPNRR